MTLPDMDATCGIVHQSVPVFENCRNLLLPHFCQFPANVLGDLLNFPRYPGLLAQFLLHRR